MKRQIIANFIVEHRINLEHDLDVDYVTVTPWNCILMDRFAKTVKVLV